MEKMGKEFGHWFDIWASGQRDRQRAQGALRAPRRCMRCCASSLLVFPRQWGGLWLPPCIAFQGVQPFQGRFQMPSEESAVGKVRWQCCSNQLSCTSADALVRGLFWAKSQVSSWRLLLNFSAGFSVLSEETLGLAVAVNSWNSSFSIRMRHRSQCISPSTSTSS